jgi:hypothetical protein
MIKSLIVSLFAVAAVTVTAPVAAAAPHATVAASALHVTSGSDEPLLICLPTRGC